MISSVSKYDFKSPTIMEVTGIAAVDAATKTAEDLAMNLLSTIDMNLMFATPDINVALHVITKKQRAAERYFKISASNIFEAIGTAMIPLPRIVLKYMTIFFALNLRDTTGMSDAPSIAPVDPAMPITLSRELSILKHSLTIGA